MTLLNPIKDVDKKPTTDITINGERPDASPPEIRNKALTSFLSTLLNIVRKVLARAPRQDNGIKASRLDRKK